MRTCPPASAILRAYTSDDGLVVHDAGFGHAQAPRCRATCGSTSRISSPREPLHAGEAVGGRGARVPRARGVPPRVVATTSLPQRSCGMPLSAQKRYISSRPAAQLRAFAEPGL